jgi:hypothetical protein
MLFLEEMAWPASRWHGSFSYFGSQTKGRAPCGCPPLLPLRKLSAAAADQQAVVVEALTTAGFAVLVYVNWHCAGVVAAVT